MKSDLIGPGKAARILGVDPKTVVRWGKDGKYPILRTEGGHHRFRIVDIERCRTEMEERGRS